jgi:hypothetical protein
MVPGIGRMKSPRQLPQVEIVKKKPDFQESKVLTSPFALEDLACISQRGCPHNAHGWRREKVSTKLFPTSMHLQCLKKMALNLSWIET